MSKALDKRSSLKEALGNPQFIADINQALPATIKKYLTPERMTKIMLTAVVKNPTLLQCTKQSIIKSMIEAASLGLELGGPLGHAYPVPFKNKQGEWECNCIPGYMGYMDIARRSGDVQTFESHVVHEKDKFIRILGTENKLIHEPFISKDGMESPGKPIGAYNIARFKDGSMHIEFMQLYELEEIRSKSKMGDTGPWKSWREEMYKKTVVRRARKYWPMNTESTRLIAKAAELDNQADNGERQIIDMDFKSIMEIPEKTRTEELNNKLKKKTKKPDDAERPKLFGEDENPEPKDIKEELDRKEKFFRRPDYKILTDKAKDEIKKELNGYDEFPPDNYLDALIEGYK